MNTIQMNLFDYFYENESFTTKEATEVIKTVKDMHVKDESVRARIYEVLNKEYFLK